MQSYGVFLKELQESIVEAIAVAENAEWHHLEVSEPEYQHYIRLATWSQILDERVNAYGIARTRRAWKTARRGSPGAA